MTLIISIDDAINWGSLLFWDIFVNEQVFLHLQNLNSTFTGFDISSIIIITFFQSSKFFQLSNTKCIHTFFGLFFNCDVIVNSYRLVLSQVENWNIFLSVFHIHTRRFWQLMNDNWKCWFYAATLCGIKHSTAAHNFFRIEMTRQLKWCCSISQLIGLHIHCKKTSL